MSYDVNKIIEESVANIMDEPETPGVIQEGQEKVVDKSKPEDETLVTEDEFEASRKFLMEAVGEPEGKKE